MTDFRIDLGDRGRAEVYFASPMWDEDAAKVIKRMDEAHIRVIGDVRGFAPDEQRARRLLRGCSGLICDARDTESLLQLLPDSEIPVLERKTSGFALRPTGSQPPGSADDFAYAVLGCPRRIPEYAFYIGRLERDFSHAREAIRCAIENESGVPFLWIDDGRHRTNVESIRERTRLLLQNASFVVADLTLGTESPDRENPSRAHEIGLSMAYHRPLLLLSQEPRRYTYFSINDLQTIFWSDENDLYLKVSEWSKSFRDRFGRTTWNYRLQERGYVPTVAPLSFLFTSNQRYIGPKTPRQTFGHRSMATIAAAVLILISIAIIMLMRTRQG